MDSNQQHLDLQSSALPLELFTQQTNYGFLENPVNMDP